MTFKPKYIAKPKYDWQPNSYWRVMRVRTGFQAPIVQDYMSMIDAICLRLKLEYGND